MDVPNLTPETPLERDPTSETRVDGSLTNETRDLDVRPRTIGKRRSATGAAQQARIAWGNEWGAEISAIAAARRRERQ